jgi:hypothetical protein
MAKLSAADRRRVPKRRFGVPSKAPASGSYPMPDRSHAINAEARASGKPVQAQVDRKARELYPDIGKKRRKMGWQETMASMRPSGRKRS